ncbi:hypothetical protein [Pedobacter helvus]|uniref:Uncharacterized protein n=1 Tax=Pedobacter helvus TaxID=2563444 RepID=A0ABW9JEH0_9SPHI|nr:hypothetical protein [Pedobacter ureilyticus]
MDKINSQSKELHDFKSFNHQEFMEQEFPLGSKFTFERSLKHMNMMTSFLVELASMMLEKNPLSMANEQLNVIYTLITSYHLRSITLAESFEFVRLDNGKTIFDDATPKILFRSLIENYLIFFYLFERNKNNSHLNFLLYELQSLLHLKKSVHYTSNRTDAKLKLTPVKVKKMMESKVEQIINHESFHLLDKNFRKEIVKVQNGSKNYINLFTFEALMRESELPTELIINEYSDASASVHSQLYGLKASQMMFEKSMNDNVDIFEKSKFRLMAQCLFLTSQWVYSFIHTIKLDFEDEFEQHLGEVISLSVYYRQALLTNK